MTIFGQRFLPVMVVVVATAVFASLFYPGQSPNSDGYNYFSAAESIVSQGRLLMADGSDFSLWPPLFPLLIAPAFFLSIPPETWNVGLTIAAIFCIIWFSYRLLFLLSGNEKSSLVVAILLLFLPAPVRVAGSYTVDLIHVGGIIAGWYYFFQFQTKKQNIKPLIFIAILLPMLRYVGIVFVGIWVGWVLVCHRGRTAAAMLITSAIEPILWEIRNLGLQNNIYQRDVHGWFAEPGTPTYFLKAITQSLFYLTTTSLVIDSIATVLILGTIGWLAWRHGWTRSAATHYQLRLIGVAALLYFITWSVVQFFVDSTLRYDIRLLLPATYLISLIVGVATIKWWTAARVLTKLIISIFILCTSALQLLVVVPFRAGQVQRERGARENLQYLIDRNSNIVATNGPGWYFLETRRRVMRIPPPDNPSFRELWRDKATTYFELTRKLCAKGGQIILIYPTAAQSIHQRTRLSETLELSEIDARGEFSVFQATPKPGACQP